MSKQHLSLARVPMRPTVALAAACLAALTAPATALALPSETVVLAQHASTLDSQEDPGQAGSLPFGLALLTVGGAAKPKAKTGPQEAPCVRLVDAATGQPQAQGDATLKGAKISVRDEAGKLVLVLETSDQGTCALDALRDLGAGTYTLMVAEAPLGYEQNLKWHPQVTLDGKGTMSAAEELTCPLDVISAGVLFSVVDAESGKPVPQGDASLAGSEIALVNKSAQSVSFDGHLYRPDEVVVRLVTDEGGECGVSEGLPFGAYEARNTKASLGYVADEAWCQRIRVDGEATILDATGSGKEREKGYEPVKDARPARLALIRGGVSVTKRDSLLEGPVAAGAASLKGARFEVVYAGTNPVWVDGVKIDAGQVAKTIETDETGLAKTQKDALPFGRWTIREKSAPSGYLTDEHFAPCVDIKEDGRLEEVICEDQVMRGDVTFEKMDVAGKALAQVPFLISSDTTGEAHLLLTDAKGTFSTASSQCPHRANTNANDRAIKADGSVDESLIDTEAGIWFSGSAGQTTEADDGRGALPFDTYTITELRSSANAGLRLRTLHVRIDSDGMVFDHGSVADEPKEALSTRLSIAENDGELIRLVDEVEMEGLVEGAPYSLSSTLHVRGTDGSDEGPLVVEAQPLRASTSFTATGKSMRVEVAFEVPAELAEGRIIVCFEELFDKEGTVVSTHADIEDEEQTVRLPHLVTSARFSGTCTGEDVAGLSLVDEVTYENLVPSELYRLSASLVDAETLEEVAHTAGTAYFIAQEATGTVEVTIPLTDIDCVGRTLVVFETLTRVSDGADICSHRDPTDEAQTVRIASISTHAEGATGTDAIAPAEDQVIYDTVEYIGLEPGAEYTLVGTLYDAREGEPLIDEDGNEVTSELTFVAEEGRGEVRVAFELDASGLKSTSLVCREALYDKDQALVAEHADLADEDQTVHVVSIETRLKDEAGVAHLGLAKGKRTLTDTVSFYGLTPGASYELKGSLLRRQKGAEATEDCEEIANATTTFTPQSESGLTSVTFEVDGDSLAGFDVIATEELYQADVLICEHTDLLDDQQTLHYPSLATEATSGGDHQHLLTDPTETVRITDALSYHNLQAGLTYDVEGTLVDASTLDEIEGAQATKRFVAPAADGTLQMYFDVAAKDMAGRTLSCLERISCEGVVVAEHADAADTRQQVSFVDEACTISMDTHFHETGSSKQEVGAGPQTKLTDTVELSGLEPGVAYELTSRVIDSESGHALPQESASLAQEDKDSGAAEDDATERATERRQTFTAKSESETLDVDLIVDTSKLASGDIVCFERLERAGTVVSVHEDHRDKDQTVHVNEVPGTSGSPAQDQSGSATATSVTPNATPAAASSSPATSIAGRTLPSTGDKAELLLLGVALGLAGTLALAAAARHKGGRPSSQRREDPTDADERP